MGDLSTLGLEWVIALDGLSQLFALMVIGVGAIVLVYASAYFSKRRDFVRFFPILLLFAASMLGVVLSDNLIMLFVFWELTSVCSYLLIGFHHEREKARSAALQALLVTGLGGLALLAGFLLLGQAAGTMRISQLPPITGHSLYLSALVLILVGAFTKSAQFPFHFWLPNAMEAPAPVSAYLHAATMVKAGVYLLARLHPALGGTEEWFFLVGGAGAVTMLLSAYLAFRQHHLKRILAYSTVSALGTLFFLLGLGTEAAIGAALVFFLGHVLYKGALFLATGNIDHETGTADIRELGGLRKTMPVTAFTVGAAAIVMAGLPPSLGFIAKESFFFASWEIPTWGLALVDLAVLTSAFIIAAAALLGMRLVFGKQTVTAHEAPPRLSWGPALLAALGVLFGIFARPAERWLLAPAASAITGEQVSLNLGLWHGWNVAVLCSVISIGLGLVLYRYRDSLLGALERLDLGRIGPARWYDAAVSGVLALARAQTRFLQNGYLRLYLLVVLAAALATVGYAFLRHGIPAMPEMTSVRFHEFFVAALVLAAAVAAVRTSSRLGAIAALGVVGYGVGVLFALFGAPDLAMTQFIVETLLVILFVFAFYRMPRYAPLSSYGSRARDAAVAIGMGALITALTLVAATVQWHAPISEYFGEVAVLEAYGRNVVNVILVDFRAMDTLGEIAVVAVAAIGVFSLLRLHWRKGEA